LQEEKRKLVSRATQTGCKNNGSKAGRDIKQSAGDDEGPESTNDTLTPAEMLAAVLARPNPILKQSK